MCFKFDRKAQIHVFAESNSLKTHNNIIVYKIKELSEHKYTVHAGTEFEYSCHDIKCTIP